MKTQLCKHLIQLNFIIVITTELLSKQFGVLFKQLGGPLIERGNIII